MKAFKGFNPDLTCRGFQFKEGETFETDKAKLCNSGFHACERPIDCFRYYTPNTAVYHEVELDGVTNEKEGDDTKRCGTRIKIGARLSVADICRLTFDYVKEHCTNENNAEAGKPATAGEYGAATAGNCGAATAGAIVEQPRRAIVEQPRRAIREQPRRASMEQPRRAIVEQPRRAIVEQPQRASMEQPRRAIAEQPRRASMEQPRAEAERRSVQAE